MCHGTIVGGVKRIHNRLVVARTSYARELKQNGYCAFKKPSPRKFYNSNEIHLQNWTTTAEEAEEVIKGRGD